MRTYGLPLHAKLTGPALRGSVLTGESQDIWAPDLSRRAPPCASGLDRDTEDLLRDWHAARARRDTR